MAYDEHLADRVRLAFRELHAEVHEKQMMGGLCFMLNDKMCAGIVNDALMARIGPEVYEAALAREGCRKMDFTGRPMNGFVFVDPEGVDDDAELLTWIQLCLDYNPKAKSSRKKKSSQ
jgi:TfoX/Sxy family transcriptional regulator of competence genes